MDIFENNSNKSKMNNSTQDRTPKEAIVSGSMNTPKKKLFGGFFARDLKTSFLEVLTGYCVNQLKNTLATGAKKIIDLTINGTTSSNANGTTNYSGIFMQRATPVSPTSIINKQNQFQVQSNSTVERIRGITFPELKDAEAVLDRLRIDIAEGRFADVATFLEYSGLSNQVNKTDYDWGWRDLSSAYTERANNGDWRIVFPKLVSLVS